METPRSTSPREGSGLVLRAAGLGGKGSYEATPHADFSGLVV